MNIHRSASIHAGTSGTTLRSKQRSPRSLIDQTINIGAARANLVLDPAFRPRAHLAVSLSADGNGVTRVDVDASLIHKVG